jgi:rare lipoprotein A
MRRPAARARLAGAAALLASALVAGCGSVPVAPGTTPAPADPGAVARPVPPRDAAPPVARPPAPRPPAPRGSRGGGYYLDDGPGDDPPTDLAAIPDAVPRAEPLHRAANRPYVVFGRRYVPRPELGEHRERGVASWYGRKFHGRPTSSGERYDMYGMTAAHPTLPIPSYVRVTNLRNGRAVVLRVNDRGPFLHRRVIDLSYTAAYKLGYVEAGSAEVEVELLTPAGSAPRPAQTAVRADVADRAAAPAAPVGTEPMPEPMLAQAAGERLSIETLVDDRPLAEAPAFPPASPAASASSASASSELRQAAGSAPVGASAGPPATWLQLGAFSTRDNAESARARFARELPWLAVPIEVLHHGGSWRVQVGPWDRRDDALAARERIVAGSAVRPIAVVR